MIKLVIDSASDITLKEAESLGVELVSMIISFQEEEYLDGVDINSQQFFEKMIESSILPKTSQINMMRFEEVYERLTKDGSEVIVITLSSKLSGTYSQAYLASEKYKDNVYVIDSLQACIGERVLLDYALKLVNEEKLSAFEIVDELNQKKNKIELLALLGTLEYLKKGGRISSLTAFAGELFSIKPVIAIKEGGIKLVGKAHGSKKGNNLLCQLVEGCGGIDFSMPFALAYSGLSDELLRKYIHDSDAIWKDHVKIEEIPVFPIGATIGSHIGPGAIAVCFFAK